MAEKTKRILLVVHSTYGCILISRHYMNGLDEAHRSSLATLDDGSCQPRCRPNEGHRRGSKWADMRVTRVHTLKNLPEESHTPRSAPRILRVAVYDMFIPLGESVLTRPQ